MSSGKTKKDSFGFLRVASVTPRMFLGDIEANRDEIIKGFKKTLALNVKLVVFPELSLTGYTLGDLFHQTLVQKKTLEALRVIVIDTEGSDAVLCVGLPLSVQGGLYNVAAVICNGSILGFVPKTYIPGYKEFYEERWFASARDLKIHEVTFFGERVPIGTDLLFQSSDDPEFTLGAEICEDLWTPIPPSSFQVLHGATVIANLSASNELIAKAEYRRNLVTQQSAKGICGYIYASAGVHESTTDLVYGGHSLICENGHVIVESERFNRETKIIYADIDLEHLMRDREKMTSFGENVQELPDTQFRIVNFNFGLKAPAKKLKRYINAYPFVPQNPAERDKRVEEVFLIQATGLAKRLENARLDKLIIGLSGGLDSTLALLVAVRAFELLGLPFKNIYAVTMPGLATTKRTKSNARKLAETLGVNIEEIDITKGVLQQFRDIAHDKNKQDITYQNVQARYRTMILMNKANQLKGIVVGTGDLSEIALGWNTFTGDHISHYNVNAGVPKTLVKYVVEWVSEKDDLRAAKKVLKDVLATPISPELVKSSGTKITQKTEDLIGPYELHDFFLYHFLRWGSGPRKILYLAEQAFSKKYSRQIIKKWLRVFIERFFKNQWKRSVMPDGPKVGSVSLSPRGDWRMPSDVEVTMWLGELTDDR